MQSHTIQCDLNVLKDGPFDINNVNLLAQVKVAPMTMFIYLRFKSLAKPMVPKISSSRYLQPSSTAKAVKRPELSLDSVAKSIIKGRQHGIPSMLLLERRV